MSMETLGTTPSNSTNRNARVAHIRKFVCVPPERGEVLRLVTLESSPTVLGEWPKVACVDNSSTPEDVDALLRDHAQAIESELQANLVWQTAEGLVCCSKRLKCRPDLQPGDPSQIAQAEALGIVGTQQGWIIQSQREREVMMRSYFSAHQIQINQYNAMVQTLGQLANESMVNAHRANLELDKLRAQQRHELDRVALLLRDATGSEDGETDARAQLITQIGGALTQALPFIVQQLGKLLTEPPANTQTVAAAPAPTVTAAEAAE
jgi:hypothetical protein